MMFFGYHKHKQKKLKNSWWHFGTQSSLWIKINFDSTVRWKELGKINVHIIYNLQFLISHRASCLWFMKHYKTKANWKNNEMPIYKIPTSLIMHLLFKNEKNTQFLNEILSKNFKSLNGFRFNSFISISYTVKKFTQEFHSKF
jgi:hypothetical protein